MKPSRQKLPFNNYTTQAISPFQRVKRLYRKLGYNFINHNITYKIKVKTLNRSTFLGKWFSPVRTNTRRQKDIGNLKSTWLQRLRSSLGSCLIYRVYWFIASSYDSVVTCLSIHCLMIAFEFTVHVVCSLTYCDGMC